MLHPLWGCHCVTHCVWLQWVELCFFQWANMTLELLRTLNNEVRSLQACSRYQICTPEKNHLQRPWTLDNCCRATDLFPLKTSPFGMFNSFKGAAQYSHQDSGLRHKPLLDKCWNDWQSRLPKVCLGSLHERLSRSRGGQGWPSRRSPPLNELLLFLLITLTKCLEPSMWLFFSRARFGGSPKEWSEAEETTFKAIMTLRSWDCFHVFSELCSLEFGAPEGSYDSCEKCEQWGTAWLKWRTCPLWSELLIPKVLSSLCGGSCWGCVSNSLVKPFHICSPLAKSSAGQQTTKPGITWGDKLSFSLLRTEQSQKRPLSSAAALAHLLQGLAS